LAIDEARCGYGGTSEEVFTDTVIRRRWKGFSDFMFWGSFAYDEKGALPYLETANRGTEEERRSRAC